VWLHTVVILPSTPCDGRHNTNCRNWSTSSVVQKNLFPIQDKCGIHSVVERESESALYGSWFVTAGLRELQGEEGEKQEGEEDGEKGVLWRGALGGVAGKKRGITLWGRQAAAVT